MNTTHQKTQIALKKAKTSIEKILEMIETEHSCEPVVQQIRAVQGLVKSAQSQIIKSHVENCLLEGYNLSPKEKESIAQSLSDTLNLLDK
jgi:DNA-binding FrmR family transcriptional regulator